MSVPASGTEKVGQTSIRHRVSGTSTPEKRSLLGFGVLHSINTALNMAFTLAQILALSRLLPLERYSEIVFLASLGFYVQPLDQALGKANFVMLHVSEQLDGALTAGRRVLVVTGAQLILICTITIAITTLISHSFASTAWIENALFLLLCLLTNFWAFELQSTAWAVGRNLAFVKLALVHRSAHFGALALGYLSGNMLLFVGSACAATVVCMSIAGRMFVDAGLFAKHAETRPWVEYARSYGVAFLATISDLLVLNAPYALISARFGIGPQLVVFDSVMKLARIVMAGARTLAEIVLSRHAALVAAGELIKARKLFLGLLIASFAAASLPAFVVSLAGSFVFHVLLSSNNVVLSEAMLPAAAILLISAIYQPAVFFLGYSNKRRPVQTFTLCAVAGLAVFTIGILLSPLAPANMLVLFGTCFAALTGIAVVQTLRLFQIPQRRS